MLGKCLGDIGKICTTTGQHNAIGKFLLVAGELDLLDNHIGHILHAGLNNRCQVALQNTLLALGGAVVDHHTLIDIGSYCTTEAHLDLLDHLFGDALCADIEVNRICSHRNRSHVADDVVVVDRYIGNIATHIDHGYTLLLLVCRKQSFSRYEGVDIDTERSDTEVNSSLFESFDRGLGTQNEVECRREALAKRTDGIGHLFVAIDNKILGDTLQNEFVVGRCAHLLHTGIKFIDIALAHAVVVVAHRNPIVVARATDKVARDTEISLQHSDIELISEFINNLFERFDCHFDILDCATCNTARRLAHNSFHNHFAIGTTRCRRSGNIL